MAVLFGTTGNVAFTSGYTLHVKKWEISAKMEAEDTTDFAAATTGAKEFTPNGLEEWEGSMLCLADGSTATTIDHPGEAAASCVLTMGTGKTFSGNIIITEVKVGPVEPGKAIEVAQTFKGTGAYTVA